MPRRLPLYNNVLAQHIGASLALVLRLENARVISSRQYGQSVRISDVELAYELAFLRVFLAWEVVLEEALVRLICGYHHSGGQEPLKPTKQYFRTTSDAERALLQGRRYQLWHNPSDVMKRAALYLNNSRYEIVLASAQQRLGYFAAVRHRIAHSQKDAKQQFNQATMTLSGRRYPGARPGKFLRDWNSGAQTPERWLWTTCRELDGLATQICQ